ncbi:tRNA (adenine(58)-N(1))-methyltransferase non-catalytic subunit TRM6 [Wyeomyia smithii]|uniref:tRNA (adenine(58)-N(1))-methyltransferase non-catalytic subunit TRM6 n=1 Tax=Wyeomyia smithii TaxID=174621 RepID=UPI002467F2EE|nr:tRNA (adenine(58)-N(1))-methyltransferase non-catalytic subunit TRM6 [Wyeomyia smithii]XP_055546048.1 tRNA (adenine(58)-N(1))-methyltransferase non-catalytic subunit TRM6 [Wyeomyia smithii]
MADTIKVGDYLVIKRQKYTKLQKFSNLDTVVHLGKDQIELRCAENHPYHSTFQLLPKEGRNKRFYVLEPIATASEIRNLKQLLIKESGTDNRNIVDDRNTQNLTTEEILKLREECESSSEVIGKLVENSKSFAAKTEYSQEKYLKRKEKKYFEYVQIKRPTIRLIADIYWRLDADKILGVRFDTLSQIISYSGICGVGNFLLYESGTNGLLPAAFLNSLGVNTEAKLAHLHPGNVAQKQALLAMGYPAEQLSRCISVNIYSVLRHYYQETRKDNDGCIFTENTEIKLVENDCENSSLTEPGEKRKNDSTEDHGPEAKQLKLAEVRKQQWELENAAGCELMKEKFDSLVIVAKEHPYNIIKSLMPFVKPSRPIVVFSTVKEIMLECYTELKASASVTYLRVTSNWMRPYQILPNRTHPDVTMSANSGYLLTGYTIR